MHALSIDIFGSGVADGAGILLFANTNQWNIKVIKEISKPGVCTRGCSILVWYLAGLPAGRVGCTFSYYSPIHLSKVWVGEGSVGVPLRLYVGDSKEISIAPFSLSQSSNCCRAVTLLL